MTLARASLVACLAVGLFFVQAMPVLNKKRVFGMPEPISTDHRHLRMNARLTRIRFALTALWAAWLLSAAALFVNQFVFDGSGIGPGLTLGIVALAVQAVMLVFVGRGSSVARALAVAFAVLAVPPLQMIPRLLVDRSLFSATQTALSFVLKATGTILLF